LITWGYVPPSGWSGACLPPVAFPYTPMIKPIQVEGHVSSRAIGYTDEHVWENDYGSGSCPADGADTYHTMGTCTSCPGVWPIFMDYNFANVALGSDNYGQPKQLGVVQRDYGSRGSMYGTTASADPWNLFTRFRFAPGASTNANFDGRGIWMGPEAISFNDISKQTAVSTAIPTTTGTEQSSEAGASLRTS